MSGQQSSPGSGRVVRAVVLCVPLLALANHPVAELPLLFSLVPFVAMLTITTYLGAHRGASWAEWTARAFDLALLGAALAVLSTVVFAATGGEDGPGDVVAIVLTVVWVGAVLGAAALALLTDDRPRWTPVWSRIRVAHDDRS